MSASGEHEEIGPRPATHEESSRAVLRVRRLLARHGPAPAVDQLVVWCPFTRLLTPVDECAGCEHAEMLSLDSDGYGSFVICRWPQAGTRAKRG